MPDLIRIIKKVKSDIDNTQKYVFHNYANNTLEFSYINKNDGKDIICVPCQTMCNVGCKFCHLTDYRGKVKSSNLLFAEILNGIRYIYQDLDLSNSGNKDLLISFMGCGEPLFNIYTIMANIESIEKEYSDSKNVRFGIATSLPKFSVNDFLDFTMIMKENKKSNVKIHLSLHYTNQKIRNEWMPAAADIDTSLALLHFYNKYTKSPIEIHYTMIEDVNDSKEDIDNLIKLTKHMDVNIKFLQFNPKNDSNHATLKTKIIEYQEYLSNNDIKSEYYVSPGMDIGASCGQFLMDEYINKELITTIA